MGRLLPYITKTCLYPLDLWRRDDMAELRYLREFEQTQFMSSGDIAALQLGLLCKLLDHAWRHCDFYRDRFDAAGLVPSDISTLDRLSVFPTLEKAQIQSARDRMVARDWPRDDLIVNQTGGSTGAPISFFLSRDRRASRAAATLRHNRWAGCDIGEKTAYLWGASRDLQPQGLKRSLRNAILNRKLVLNTAHITESKLLSFNEELKGFRPKTIFAYARAMVLFARFVSDRGLVPFQPHSIVTSAEVLTDADRQLIETVFGCRVFNRYGSREVSVLASECDHHNGLHTMAEGLFLEIVRPDGSAVAPGETGSILVTDLLNPAMPLIRYRNGDMGSWIEGTCECGRGLPRLGRIDGRVTDFLVAADGALVSGVFLATYLVAQRPSLGRVQIVQSRRNHVLFNVCKSANFDAAADPGYLVEAARKHLGRDMAIDVDYVQDIPLSASGKLLFSHSTVAPDFVETSAS